MWTSLRGSLFCVSHLLSRPQALVVTVTVPKWVHRGGQMGLTSKSSKVPIPQGRKIQQQSMALRIIVAFVTFWDGPHSVCGVCFSLNKSTSYLKKRIIIATMLIITGTICTRLAMCQCFAWVILATVSILQVRVWGPARFYDLPSITQMGRSGGARVRTPAFSTACAPKPLPQVMTMTPRGQGRPP